jgi:subtilisin family serine protease
MSPLIDAVTLVLLLAAAHQAPPAEKKVIPNDPLFKYQIGFANPGGQLSLPTRSFKPSLKEFEAVAGVDADLTHAWAITTGRKDIVVAVLDDGFFYGHEDIRDNIWQNPGETGLDAAGYAKETNGVDDDHNGYVDDVIGWDFAFEDPDPDPYIFDGKDDRRIQPYWHSISALGIIGARGNNGVGVAGVNWDVSLMLLKIGAQGVRDGMIDVARNERAARAIRYAADNGARVINWSGYVSDFRPDRLAVLKAAIDYAASKNVLFVVGAGNDGRDIDLPENFTYPACFDNENILTVAEIDFRGNLYRYTVGDRVLGSNFGARNVDIGAVGDNFTTGLKDNRSVYGLSGGTSNSGPVAAGVAALVLSIRPDLGAAALRRLLLQSATPLTGLKGKILSGGMVSASGALRAAR